MKQLDLWEKLEAQKKANEKIFHARKTQVSRVVNLHEWRNKNTGEICRLTINESLILKARNPNQWKWVKKLHKVIQGDAVDWLTYSPVLNGRKDLQHKNNLNRVWENIVVIMAKYHQGNGTKKIAKEFGYSAGEVLYALKDAGVDTTKRRNYIKQSDSLSHTDLRKRAYHKLISTPSGLLKKRVMSRIGSAMKAQVVNNTGSFSLVGCSDKFLRFHIESKFQSGMSWDNYGEWHVDHIRPCASFDLSDREQMKQCFNWKNLQPLWATENIKKSDIWLKQNQN
jgi:hypothetical protein